MIPATTRRRFLTGAAAMAAALAAPFRAGAAALPGEPTRPIDPSTLDLAVFKYPDGQTRIPPGGVVDFLQLRIEARISPTTDWPDRLEPSEHWRASISYSGPDQDARIVRRLVQYWWGKWDHQNKPGNRAAAMEHAQFNHRLSAAQNGLHRIEIHIRGDVSGLEATRTFEFVAAV